MYDLAAIIPVRRGSSRIREKCLLPFGDQDTLIEWKLAQLTKVLPPDRIYLSSEDEHFLSLGERFGVSLHQRDPYLATDHIASFSEIITGIVQEVAHEHIAWCTAVCPLMSPREYAESFDAYHREVIAGNRDSLLGVNLTKEYFWSRDGALNYEASRNHTISQDLPDWFKVTNSLYMAPRAQILRDGYFLGRDPLLKELSKLAAVDIDYIEDYRIARALYALYREEGLDELSDTPRFSAPQISPQTASQGAETSAPARYDCIFFDFDGVIVDSVDAKIAAFGELYDEFGPEIRAAVEEYQRDVPGETRFDKIPRFHRDLLGETLSAEEIGEWCDRLSDIVLDQVVAAPLLPSVREVLAQLVRQGTPAHIVSGTPHDELQVIVERKGLSPFFRTARGAPEKKAAICADIMAREGYRADRCLFVGDAMTDYDCARAVGMDFLGRADDAVGPFPSGTSVVPAIGDYFLAKAAPRPARPPASEAVPRRKAG